MTKDKALTGAAGEYYIAFRLAAEGYAVGLTPRGTTSIDLIVAKPSTGKSITIQTKTMLNAFVQNRKHGNYWKWRVGKPREPHKTFFYVFVDLKNDLEQTPDVFIVPSSQLASLREEFSGDFWCNGIDEEVAPSYKNRWDIIEAAQNFSYLYSNVVL